MNHIYLSLSQQKMVTIIATYISGGKFTVNNNYINSYINVFKN